MSKVGKLPVAIPAGVTVTVANGLITVKGPKGELKQSFHDEIDIKVEGTEVVLTTKNNAKQTNAYHGLYRSLINTSDNKCLCETISYTLYHIADKASVKSMISICLLCIVLSCKNYFCSFNLDINFIMEALFELAFWSFYRNKTICYIYCNTCWNSNRKLTYFRHFFLLLLPNSTY